MNQRLLLVLTAGLLCMMNLHSQGNPDSGIHNSIGGPKIAFDTAYVNLGRIQKGDTAKHTFLIRNIGSSDLSIRQATPSCGCTAAILGDSIIPPGKTSKLTVLFDSHNKAVGPVSKAITIISNSSVDSIARLDFQVTVYEDTVTEHMRSSNGRMMHVDGIFQGNCATCHRSKGEGKYGADLYTADCAICHGSAQDNKPAKPLPTLAMMNRSARTWLNTIGVGIANSNMPGFSRKRGGPLNDAQIASIVEYLRAIGDNGINNLQPSKESVSTSN